MTAKAVPVPTPETQRFWDGTRDDELWIQRCDSCGSAYFYPRPSCPRCGSEDVAWMRASGRARLYSYVISYLPAPGFEDDVPYVIAIVELVEGPRMMTNIVGVDPDPDRLVLDMPLRVRFTQRGEVSLPMFAPAAENQGKQEAS
ncbi:MAG: Zn-ribbon domain-containing OB-fold protein [Streptosporangiales bacterium]